MKEGKNDYGRLNECMHVCMHGLTVVCVCVCVCVAYVYVVGWFGRLVCRVEQSTFKIVEAVEPLRIAISLPTVHL